VTELAESAAMAKFAETTASSEFAKAPAAREFIIIDKVAIFVVITILTLANKAFVIKAAAIVEASIVSIICNSCACDAAN